MGMGGGAFTTGLHLALQGYLAHKEQPPPWTLQKDYAQSSMVVLGGRGLDLMREFIDYTTSMITD